MTDAVARDEVRALWDSIWPTPVVREPSAGAGTLTLRIGEEKLEITLLEDVCPDTVAAVRESLPLTGYFVHAAWSGEVIRGVGPVDLPGSLELENATIFCAPGDVVYCPEHRELSVVYGDNDMRMADGPVSSSVWGQIRTDVGLLQKIGRDVRLFGVVRFTITQ
ncbi:MULTISPECIES: DUF3830 family protein [Nocardioides]|uniref:DUF3830 family protein n=1 Tax=Nocardioides vastitatis TaxID=2568655 RepID=A0ABW0ZD50_9ACTN|nr:DUF3830 family protein [Nocardioides sp.]THI96865.1 DUF3830 family protein [Nocardioides sp.]